LGVREVYGVGGRWRHRVAHPIAGRPRTGIRGRPSSGLAVDV
jgi:hypothetical protein